MPEKCFNLAVNAPGVDLKRKEGWSGAIKAKVKRSRGFAVALDGHMLLLCYVVNTVQTSYFARHSEKP